MEKQDNELLDFSDLDDLELEAEISDSEESNNTVETDNINIDTEEKQEKVKSKKKGKKEPTDIVQKEKEKYLLYIVTDKPKNGLLTFFRERGINVTKIFASISSARDELVMQIEPFRLVVIDTGTGMFTSTANRKQIIDIVSLSDDSINVTVFYTDSILKLETNANIKNKKDITWFKYVSTVDVLAKLLFYSMSEEYIYETSKPYSEVLQSKESILKLRGLEFKGNDGPPLIVNGVDGSSLEKFLLGEDTESLQTYHIKLKM